MDNTERLIQRYLARQATPAEVLELTAIAAREGTTLEELIVRDSFKTFSDHYDTVEATEGEFDRQAFHHQKLTPALPKADHTTREKPEAKVIPIRRGFRWRRAAAAITAIVVASGIGYWMKNDDSLPETSSVTYKGRGFVVLPDNSRVIMNDGSELTVPTAFGKSDRTVLLTGEAFFDVQHDPAKPFIVHTEKVHTTVLGTKFNIRESEGKITVTVAAGRVNVADQHRHEQISRNEQIEVNVAAGKFSRSVAVLEDVLAWQKDYLILYDIPLSEAAPLIEKRFHVNVTITNDSLKSCKVYVSSLHNESLKQIVTGLTLQLQAGARIESNTVIIEGGRGCSSQE